MSLMNPRHRFLQFSPFLAVFLLLAGTRYAAAQPGMVTSESKQSLATPRVNGRLGTTQTAASAEGGPIRVVRYDLDLVLNMFSENLGGSVSSTVVLTAPSDSITLNAVALQLDSIFVDGLTASVLQNPAAESITIPLGSIRPQGDTVHLRIFYRRLPGVQRPSSRLGYYYFPESIGIPANLGYTMSEPSDARFWFPCLDEPWAKARASIKVTLPVGYVAASNGRLLGVQDNSDGTATWNWDEEHQIAPYLMCITASQFEVSTLPFLRAPGDTVPLQYYAWLPDENATSAYLPTVARMMSVLSNLYGPYPFDKYGMASVIPFSSGGMEHQTITTMNRFLQTDERVVVHELGHQWWGDLVTCGSWPDIWLNEGFATYTEALWAESKGGPQALQNYVATQLSNFNRASWQGSVYDPVGNGYNLFDDVVYSKAARVLHTLRGLVGDSTFFHILAAYRARYAGGSAITDQLAAVVDSVTGSDMRWFFNQWIYGKGWPKLTADYVWNGDSLIITMEQVQQSDWPLFRLPMTVRATTVAGTATWAITDSLRSQVFRMPLSSVPVQVVVDPDNWVLKQISGTASGDLGLTSAVLEQNYPNPFNATTQIQYAVPAPSSVKIVVFDLLGREVATLLDATRDAGRYVLQFDGKGYASGVYFCRMESSYTDGSGSSTVIRKMILIH